MTFTATRTETETAAALGEAMTAALEALGAEAYAMLTAELVAANSVEGKLYQSGQEAVISGLEAAMAAKALRAQAAQHDQDAAASFERCDTDGFVSQWASGQMADLRRREAELAEHGGRWTFARTELVTLDGQPTDAREVQTKYGYRWRLDSTDQWLPVSPKRASTLAKHGYREVETTEVAPAAARHSGSGRGLAGATSVHVVIYRTDTKQSGWRPVGAPAA